MSTLICVNTTREQFEYACAWLGSYDLHDVPSTSALGEQHARSTAIIVFAQTYEEDAAKARCREIRQVDSLDEVPLFVAVTQYQMPLANAVRRLGNAGHLFLPLNEGKLREEIKQLGSSDESNG